MFSYDILLAYDILLPFFSFLKDSLFQLKDSFIGLTISYGMFLFLFRESY